MSLQLDRRTFLGSTAALAATTAVGSHSNAGEFTGKIKKAVKYHMVTDEVSVRDKFKMLVDLGFDGVEIRTRDTVDRAEAL